MLVIAICLPGLPAYGESVIFQCKNSQGKTIFTDNKRLCEEQAGNSRQPVEEVELDPINLHSQYGKHVSEEYSNYAFRAYEPLPGYALKIIVEKKLIESSPQLVALAAKKLENAVSQAIGKFPARIRPEFDGVRYFLFSGAEAMTGGRRGGQWYFQRGNITSIKFNDSIVIRSAKQYLRYSDKEALQTAAHELSHAYYYYHIARLYGFTKKAFEQAQTKGLYRNVKTRLGGTIRKAYALTNEREYFAELVRTYLVGNYHFPFNRKELKEYDPAGYQLVLRAFGKQK